MKNFNAQAVIMQELTSQTLSSLRTNSKLAFVFFKDATGTLDPLLLGDRGELGEVLSGCVITHDKTVANAMKAASRLQEDGSINRSDVLKQFYEDLHHFDEKFRGKIRSLQLQNNLMR